MSEVKIQIYLNQLLPERYVVQELLGDEPPVKNIEELCTLYGNKYESFGTLSIYIYDSENPEPFIEALNTFFASTENPIQVDSKLLKQNIQQLTPMIIVDGEIVSRGVYPDLTALRGGSNSVSRGCSGGLCQH